MKSLLDIQQDVRNLEGNVQEITKRIKALNSDIADIRNAEYDAEYDFQKIELLARKISFEEHPLGWLKSAGSGICQAYLELLLALVQLDSEEKATIDRMVFIQWLQMKSGIVLSLDDLYKNTLKMDRKRYFELLELICGKYREYFIVDALIVSNITGAVNRAMYEYIADIAAVFEISSQEVKRLALIAKITLKQEEKNLSEEQKRFILDHGNEYGYYISEVINRIRRNLAVKVNWENVADFYWERSTGEKIKVNDVLAYYYTLDDCREHEIRATVSGRIFAFRNKNTYYGVISDENDNLAAIMKWVKEMNL